MNELARLGLVVDSEGVVRATKGLQDLESQGKKTEDGLTSGFNAIEAAITLAGGALAAFSFSSIISESAQFQQKMLEVNAIAGATADEFERLTSQARLYGAGIERASFNAAQAADAQNALAAAGLSANQILSATPGVLQLAVAASTDLGTAAQIATDTLAGFGLGVESLARVNDVLAGAAAISAVGITDLGQALSYAAPIAKSVGVSVEEVSAAIGVLGDAGLRGSRAGTGLTGVIRQLTNVTTEGEAALKNYGLRLDDVDIKNRGLSQVLTTLREAGIGTSDMFQIFGTEAGAAANILVAMSDKVIGNTTELRSMEGAAQAMADTLGSGLSTNLAQFSGAIGELQLQIGGLSNTMANDLVVAATGVVQVYNGLLGPFAEANNLSREQIQLIETLAPLVVTLGAGVGTYAIAIGAATTAQWAFNAAAAVNPYVLIATGIAVVVTALYQFRDRQEEAIELWERAKESAAGYAEAQNNLGTHFKAMNQLYAEREELQKALTSMENLGYGQTVNAIQARSRLAEVEASLQKIIDKRIAAEKEQAKRVEETRKAEEELAEQRKKAQELMGKAEEEAAKLQNKLKADREAAKAAEERAKIEQKLSEANRERAETEDLINAAIEIGAAARKKEIDDLEALRMAIDPAYASMIQFEQVIQRLQDLFDAGLIDEAELERLTRLFQNATKDASKFEKSGVAAAKSISEEFQEAANRIDESLASAFVSALRDIDSFEEHMVSAIENIIAEFALLQAKQYAAQMLGTAGAGAGQGGGAGGGGNGAGAALGGLAAAAGPYALIAVAAAAAVQVIGKQLSEDTTKMRAEYRQGIQSTGTVLGDLNAKSQSLNNSIEHLRAITENELSVSYAQLRALEEISSGIMGLTRNIAQTIDFDKTEIRQEKLGTFTRMNVGYFMDPLADLFGGSGFGNLLNTLNAPAAGLINAIAKGLFSEKRTLIDAGIQFGEQTVGAILDGLFAAQQYATIETKKKRLFATIKSATEQTSELDSAFTGQFQTLFENVANVVIDSLSILSDASEDTILQAVRAIELEAQKISLKGLTAEEQAKELQAYISSVFDQIGTGAAEALDLSGLLDDFQQIGEGAFQTLSRLATELLVFREAIDMFGMSLGDSNVAAAEITQIIAELSGGFEKLQSNLQTYYAEFFTEEEKLARLTEQLTEAFAEMGLEFPESKAGFRELVEGLDLTTEAGQEMFARLMQLAPIAAQVFDAIKTPAEEAAQQVSALAAALAELASGSEQVSEATRQQINLAQGILDSLDEQATRNRKLQEAYALVGTNAGDLNATLETLGSMSVQQLMEFATGAGVSLEQLSDAVGLLKEESERLEEVETARIERIQQEREYAQGIIDSLDQEAASARQLHEAFALLGTNSANLEATLQALRTGGVENLMNIAAAAGVSIEELGAAIGVLGAESERRKAAEAKAKADAESALQDIMRQVVEQEREAQRAAEQARQEQLRALEEQLELAKKLRDFLSDLQFSELSISDPGQRMSAAQSEYLQLLGRAQRGDKDAAENLGAAAQQYLEEADKFYGRTDEYAQIFTQVQGAIGAVAAAMEAGATSGRETLEERTYQATSSISAGVEAQLRQLLDNYKAQIEQIDKQKETTSAIVVSGTSTVTAANQTTEAVNNAAIQTQNTQKELVLRVDAMRQEVATLASVVNTSSKEQLLKLQTQIDELRSISLNTKQEAGVNV